MSQPTDDRQIVPRRRILQISSGVVSIAVAGCSGGGGGQNCREERVRSRSVPIFRGEGLTGFYEKEWSIEVESGDVLAVSAISATEENDEAEMRLHVEPVDWGIEGEYETGFLDRLDTEYRFPDTGTYVVRLREQAPVLVVGKPEYERASWTIDVVLHEYERERVCE